MDDRPQAISHFSHLEGTMIIHHHPHSPAKQTKVQDAVQLHGCLQGQLQLHMTAPCCTWMALFHAFIQRRD